MIRSNVWYYLLYIFKWQFKYIYFTVAFSCMYVKNKNLSFVEDCLLTFRSAFVIWVIGLHSKIFFSSHSYVVYINKQLTNNKKTAIRHTEDRLQSSTINRCLPLHQILNCPKPIKLQINSNRSKDLPSVLFCFFCIVPI